MTYRHIFELHPHQKFDQERALFEYSHKRPVDLTNCKITQIPDPLEAFGAEFLDYIQKKGISSFVNKTVLLEALTTPGNARPAMVSLMHSFLAAITVTTELVIIDPYFLTKQRTPDPGYPAFVAQVLAPTLINLQTLTLITDPKKCDSTILAQIRLEVHAINPKVRVIHLKSTLFHDRFWLEPNSSRAFITGTSLNSIGRKYALIDHLQSVDAIVLVQELRKNNLL